jgi:two-component system chemotaxis response regulator CheB
VPARDLVVVGASAGGVDALKRFVSGLPADLPASVLVVLHLPPHSHSNLPDILARSGPLPAVAARDGMPLEAGRILCAPPDHHLTLTADGVRVVRGPHENLHRPSVDVLFRSAALHHGARTCGVVLSGALDDGASGMRLIARAGGLTIVQEPSDALVPSMPRSVLDVLRPDAVLAAEEIGGRLSELLREPRRLPDEAMEHSRDGIRRELAMSELEPTAHDAPPPGQPSTFGCPDCGGVLWEAEEEVGGDLRFRCRVGHAYTPRALLTAGDHRLEDALWAALRALEEQESLARRMSERSWAGVGERTRDRLRERMTEAHRRAEALREFLLTPMTDGSDLGDGREEAAAGEGSGPAAGATDRHEWTDRRKEIPAG